MTAAQTADRIVAGRFQIAPGITYALGAELGRRRIPVIVADNVAEYVRRHFEQGKDLPVGGWPCLAPPWPIAFIEYQSGTGRQRRGVLAMSLDLWNTSPENLRELNEHAIDGLRGALEDAATNFPDAEVRWLMTLAVYVDDLRLVSGPVGSVITALDPRGRELGNRWVLRKEFQWEGKEEAADGHWLYAACTPAWQTIAFSHCRNVVVGHERRPEKLERAYRKRHGQNPVRWQTVRLELPRRQQDGHGRGGGTTPDLHIVAGHFSHYGDCCPDQHEPRGKLFGRLEGVYWMPQHLRGNPEREVRSDRVVTVGE